MSGQRIEDVINDVLLGDTRKNALDYAKKMVNARKKDILISN